VKFFENCILLGSMKIPYYFFQLHMILGFLINNNFALIPFLNYFKLSDFIQWFNLFLNIDIIRLNFQINYY